MSNKDLHKFLKALHNEKIISKSSLIALFKTNFNNKQSSLGYSKFNQNNLTTHYHQGSSYNFEALAYHNVKEKLFITLTTNNKNFKVTEIMEAIENIILGKPYKTPKKSIYLTIRQKCYDDVNKGILYYYQLKKEYPNTYDFSDPSQLNRVGYKLLSKNQIEDALKIFKLLIEEFPDDANSYDSYGEALFVNKQYHSSLKNYQKSLALNPKNNNAIKKIEQLKSKINTKKQIRIN